LHEGADGCTAALRIPGLRTGLAGKRLPPAQARAALNPSLQGIGSPKMGSEVSLKLRRGLLKIEASTGSVLSRFDAVGNSDMIDLLEPGQDRNSIILAGTTAPW